MKVPLEGDLSSVECGHTVEKNGGRDMRPKEARKIRAMMVRDLMTDHVFTLRPHDDLDALYELMDAKHVRHVPVVDREGDLVGLVTQRDLSHSALGTQEDLPLSLQQEILRRRKVREIMATEVDTVEPDEDLKTAAEMLIENKIGCLPVVEGEHLVGILTESDFVRLYVKND
jgi:CBS domain-containing membrane protein